MSTHYLEADSVGSFGEEQKRNLQVLMEQLLDTEEFVIAFEGRRVVDIVAEIDKIELVP